MGAFTLEHLLRMAPYEALLISYNELHGTQLNPRYVVIDEIIDSTGPELTLRLKAASFPPNSEEGRFTGEGTITVQRLDIGELFGNVPVAIPTGGRMLSYDAARYLTQRSGIVFDSNDFVETILTPENNVLRASPNSLRWYGQLTIV